MTDSVPAPGPAGSSAQPPGEIAARQLGLVALVLAVLTAVALSFVLRLYASTTTTSDGGQFDFAQTLWSASGALSVATTFLPAVLALAPLGLPPGIRAQTRPVAAILISAYVALGAATIGAFFLPVAVLAWVSAGARRLGTVGPTGRRAWRVAGALVLALPPLALLLGLVSGSLAAAGGGVAALVLALAVAVAFGIGWRWADLLVAALGLALLLTAVAAGGMLVLGFWLAGGVWLVVGLSAWLLHRGRVAGGMTREVLGVTAH